MQRLFILILSFCSVLQTEAQELNAQVNVNASKIQGVSQDLFTEMQKTITSFMNETRWTQAKFGINEKIDCSISIIINSADGNAYTGEISVSSRRPVYNSNYTTPTFNFRDQNFSFEYQPGQNIDYNQTMASSNLSAVLSFYAYVILGIDFDTFSPSGGKPYFEQAMNIANSAQSLGGEGWRPFVSDKDRYALILALTEDNSRMFHSMYYNYHRKGLDEMSGNLLRGRLEIENSLDELKALYESRPSSVLLSVYSDTKLSEVTLALQQSNEESRKEAYKLLSNLFPTQSSVLDALKK